MIKVIIADDEAKVCTLIMNLVDWSEFDMEIVGVAHNGLEALDLIETQTPDIIITDIRMPGCDGLELIERAKAINPEIEFIIVSGYRQFEYAQTAIKYGVSNYLLKPLKKDELRSTLSSLHDRHEIKTRQISDEQQTRIRQQLDSTRLRGIFMSDILSNPDQVPESISEINGHYHFEWQDGLFRAVIVKIDIDDEINEEELSVLGDKISVAFQNMKDCCFDFILCRRSSRIYGIINYSPSNTESIDQALKLITDTLNIQKSAFSGLEFTVCLGSPKDKISDAALSVEEAKIALGQRLISFPGRVISYDNITRLSGYDHSLITSFSREAVSCIELLDVQKLSEIAQRFTKALAGDDSISGRSTFDAVTEAFTQFCLIIKNFGMSHETEQYINLFYNDADMCKDVSLLFELFKERLCAIITTIAGQRENEEQKPIRIAKEFIKENYMNPITLEQVSGTVGFNSSYFSTFFKKKCGMGFLEYLSDVRIKKAKELLRETDLPVSEICERVGYYDIKHFSKTFKKLTGINPAEFRKLYS